MRFFFASIVAISLGNLLGVQWVALGTLSMEPGRAKIFFFEVKNCEPPGFFWDRRKIEKITKIKKKCVNSMQMWSNRNACQTMDYFRHFDVLIAKIGPYLNSAESVEKSVCPAKSSGVRCFQCRKTAFSRREWDREQKCHKSQFFFSLV